MRVAFLGTPAAAVPSLVALVDAGHDVRLVVTRADRRRGRGAGLSASPVKVAALARGLRVAHSLASLEGLDAERGVVVAYGALIPAPILAWLPMLNVHFSLLPRWRGAAPVQRAILAGDATTGVSVISLEATLDTGPVHVASSVPVGEKSARELTEELAHLGAAALLRVLASAELLAHPSPQVGEATYADKLVKEDFHVTPVMAASIALRTVRLGGAFLFVDERRVTVEVARESGIAVSEGLAEMRDGRVVFGVSDGSIEVQSVRPAGSSTMEATAWWRGQRGRSDARQWS